MRSFYFALAALLGVLAGPQQASAAYMLANTDSYGNGTVTDNLPVSYTIYGSDNCGASINNYTTYTTSATQDALLTFAYSYVTPDTDSSYDPAGYVINGIYHQLTPDTLLTGVVFSGIITFGVSVSDVYGFYVLSTDSNYGLAEITVSPSAVPLPAALPLFGSALLGMGAFVRRKRA